MMGQKNIIGGYYAEVGASYTTQQFDKLYME